MITGEMRDYLMTSHNGLNSRKHNFMSDLKRTISERAIELAFTALLQIALLAGALWVNSKLSEYRIDTVEKNLQEQTAIVRVLAEGVKQHEIRAEGKIQQLDDIIRRIGVLESRMDRIDARLLNSVKP